MRFVCLFWQNALFPAIAWTLRSVCFVLFQALQMPGIVHRAAVSGWCAHRVHSKVMPKCFCTFCLFQLFDMDEDGTITEDEFASIIQSALRLPELDVSVLFKEIDADKTGKLSYGKLHPFVRKNSLLVVLTGVSFFNSLKVPDGSHALFLGRTVEAQTLTLCVIFLCFLRGNQLGDQLQ